MGNKVLFKKFCIAFIIAVTIFGTLLFFSNYKEYSSYKKTINSKIVSLIEKIKEKYPEIEDKEIIEILNSTNFKRDYLQKYGYNVNEDTYLEEMKINHNKFILTQILIFSLSIISITIIILIYYNKRNKEIKNIIQTIEKINRKNYELELKDFNEDELSILKSEIYKTTLMLKESAENSKKDKINLKNSLSDISHQLKTPLTSILITLDNLLDDENMEASVRSSFIKDIKKDIIRINFLVQSILKMSKFNTNTINFIEEPVMLSEIINEAIKNVSTICDLKNIIINVKINQDALIKCDKTWQIEAFTNIIKNSIEHSEEGSTINIRIDENNVYKEIIIEDFGTGISEEDLNHIFERFYKSQNSHKDSVGIGLELAKKIIETFNGRISVKSTLGKGTTFIIKYFGK